VDSVELFAGAGGLAMGLAGSDFQHRAIIERNQWACDSVRFNKRRAQEHPEFGALHFLTHWPDPFQGDVREFDYSDFEDQIALVSGGPPCQPFSVGGKHRGEKDARDMFPEAARAVRELRPGAFIFENVQGLMREKFATYLEYIKLRLSYPEVTGAEEEDWQDHLARLEQHHTAAHQEGLEYRLLVHRVDAADFGVPQRRRRVIIVGFRSDLGVEWAFPQATHSKEALVWDKWVSGEYWAKHQVPEDLRGEPTRAEASILRRLRRADERPKGKRWLTVRDALVGLPDPERKPLFASRFENHVFQPGARVYKGHTGSPLDWPAKTLKAGDHGVPGGENMLVRDDGSVRYFTVRESGRLQGFPDEYVLQGAWSEAMRQLGNAVPVQLAQVIGDSVSQTLEAAQGGADA